MGRKTLFPSEAAKRRAVRAIARVAGSRLVQHSVVDDHVHVEVVCEAHELGGLRSALARSLGPLAAAELEPSFVVEVTTRSHLRRNVRYFLEQGLHHRLEGHPAVDAGCCFQDLVGARLLPGFDPLRLKEALPRLRRQDLLEIVGLPPEALEPMAAEGLRRAGAFRIVDAAAAALAVGPPLTTPAGGSVARRAAAQVAELGGVSRRELRDALALTSRAVRRLCAAPVDPKVTRAVRLRLSLEEAVARSRTRRAG